MTRSSLSKERLDELRKPVALMSFTELLRTIREGYRFKQKDVAEKLGITPQYYCDLEQGRRDPTPELVDKLCDFYGRGPNGRLQWHFAAAQVQGWKIGAFRESLDAAVNERESLLATISRQREALGFYEDPFGKCDQVPDFYREMDFGETARKARGEGS
jgi:transcriptional regulator with XRE-family HTH domain